LFLFRLLIDIPPGRIHDDRSYVPGRKKRG
jgi:hypothetical protein